MKESTVLAENLKKLRKLYGLTQQQLAETIGQKRSTYAYYEHGVTPNTSTILKLAKIFEISTHELIYGTIETRIEPDPLSPTGKLEDGSSIFKTNTAPVMVFPDLSIDEKELILNMRLLPPSYKQELLENSRLLIEKTES